MFTKSLSLASKQAITAGIISASVLGVTAQAATTTFDASSKVWLDVNTGVAYTSQPPSSVNWDLSFEKGLVKVNPANAPSTRFAQTTDYAAVTAAPSAYPANYAVNTMDSVDNWQGNRYTQTGMWNMFAYLHKNGCTQYDGFYGYGSYGSSGCPNNNKPFGWEYHGVKQIQGANGILTTEYKDVKPNANNYWVVRTTEGRYVRIQSVNMGDSVRNGQNVPLRERTNNAYLKYAVQEPGQAAFGAEQEWCLSTRHGNTPVGATTNPIFNGGDRFFKQEFVDFDNIVALNSVPTGDVGAFAEGCRSGDYRDVSVFSGGNFVPFYVTSQSPDYARRLADMQQGLVTAKKNWDAVLGIYYPHNIAAATVTAAVNGNRTNGSAAAKMFNYKVTGITPALAQEFVGEGKSEIEAYDHLNPTAVGQFGSNGRVYQVQANGVNYKLQITNFDSSTNNYTVQFDQL